MDELTRERENTQREIVRMSRLVWEGSSNFGPLNLRHVSCQEKGVTIR